jgi:hypothetical protein
MQADGPLVEVQLAVGSAVETALRAAGAPIPPPVQALAMIDTGATRSVIRQGLTAQLRLNPVGTVRINTPSSANFPCYEYLMRLFFPNGVRVEGVFIEAPLQGQNIQFLIGRDVLSRAVLVYLGYRNSFTLSF